MSLISEFKEFAMKGNVVDMAVGIVIGAAFGKIVSAFVDAVVMPALGWVIGGVDFSSLAITLGESAATGSVKKECVAGKAAAAPHSSPKKQR